MALILRLEPITAPTYPWVSTTALTLLDIYYVLCPLCSALPVLTTTQRGRNYQRSHFTDEQTEAKRTSVTCPKSPRWLGLTEAVWPQS